MHLLCFNPFKDCDDSSDEKNCRMVSYDKEKYLKNKPPGMRAPPRPAPPRAKMAAPARPDPEKFQHCPAPPRKKIVLPRPENIDRMFRGKVRGKCSYITKRFCESKTFEQYFLAPKVLLVAPKVLLEDIQIPPIHF